MALREDVEGGIDEEIRQPLMREANNLADGEDGARIQRSSKGHPWTLYLSTLVPICGSFELGYCLGYSSPTQTAITKDFSLSLAEYSMFGSILTIGAMIGALTSGTIADFIGRKGALRISGVINLAGWLTIYFAKGVLFLDIGRVATGYGLGVFSYVVPVFVAEIAPNDLRGALTAMHQLMISSGVSIAYIIGTVLTWRALALTGLIPCTILLFGLFFIPESPRWLVKTGKEKEFETVLQKLRGKDVDISQEATEIQDYIQTLEQLPKATVVDLFQRRYLRAVIIGVGLMAFQQFGGITGICFYASNIFESSGYSSSVGTISFAIVKVIVTGLSITVIDRFGRRPLLLVAATGLLLGCILTGTSFYLKDHELVLNSVSALALAGMLLYIGSYSTGMGAVPWIIVSEIFPINVKGAAGSLAITVSWFGAWAVTSTFNFLMAWSSYGTFSLYAVINALGILFVATMVPETKRRTLEQIQAAINA